MGRNGGQPLGAAVVIREINLLLKLMCKRTNSPAVVCLGPATFDERKYKPYRFHCAEHGNFLATPRSIECGAAWACKQCKKKYLVNKVRRAKWPAEIEAIKALAAERGYKILSRSYAGSYALHEFECPQHGPFKQYMNRYKHQKHWCPKCILEEKKPKLRRFDKTSLRQLLSSRNIQLLSWGGVVKSPAVLRCCTCQKTWQTQALDGILYADGGCPYCSTGVSRGENSLFDFIRSLRPDAKQSYRLQLGGKSFRQIDILCGNIGIEFNGTYWHSTAARDRYGRQCVDRMTHRDKYDLCAEHGIRLIYVWEHDWILRRPAVEHMLRNALIETKGIYARKTNLVRVDGNTAAAFYEKYHIQGRTRPGLNYGLARGRKLLAVMTFCKPYSHRGLSSPDHYELARFASSVRVVGGASKLLAAFVREYSPREITSYSDIQHFEGGLYERLGFIKVHESGPDYKVLWRRPGEMQRVRPKTSSRRSELAKLSGFDPNLSESVNIERLGLAKLYDCGKIKWVLAY